LKRHASDIKENVEKAVQAQGLMAPFTGGGREAAIRTVELMTRTFGTLKPRDLVTEYTDGLDQGLQRAEIVERLWERFKDATIAVIADGCRYLALMWQSAWKEGGGEKRVADLGAVAQPALVAIYSPTDFLESFLLTEIGDHLKGRAGQPAAHDGRP